MSKLAQNFVLSHGGLSHAPAFRGLKTCPMRFFSVLFLLCLWLSYAGAQTDSLSVPYKVSGKLVYEKDKKPHAGGLIKAFKIFRNKEGAIVRMEEGLPQQAVRTDAGGQFELTLYGSYEYALSCLVEGYVPNIGVEFSKKVVSPGGLISINISLVKAENGWLRGQVVDEDYNMPVADAVVTATDLQSGLQTVLRSDSTGGFRLLVSAKSRFQFSARKRKYLAGPDMLFEANTAPAKGFGLRIPLRSVAAGRITRLPEFPFEINEDTLRAVHTARLGMIYDLLIQNPEAKIEIGCHSDSRGEDEYNLHQSQKRAEAIRHYLVALGIAEDRMVAVGYGEKLLVNHCANGVRCNTREHEENRRVEIKILEYPE